MLDDPTIAQVLAGVSAAHEQLDPDTWRAVLPLEGRSFRVFVRRQGSFWRIELSPFLSLPADSERAGTLIRELLKRNRTLTEARFSLADDDDVVVETVFDGAGGEAALAASIDALVAAVQAHYSPLGRI
jgi:hypothetical protein